VAAVAAFRSGAYREAERLLGQFAAQHSSDERAQDAAFLRAVALDRSGDRAAAAAAARQYLLSFPGGLRKGEAQRLIESAQR
jgi:outer membrane protein assembly factor BamD (BamD/ComL family)